MKLLSIILAAVFLISTTPWRTAEAHSSKVPPQKQARTRKGKRKPATPPVSSLMKTLPSGLSYIITRRGEGRQPLAGEKVQVNYTGLLSSGVKFDSSYDRGRPFTFPLGKGAVIKGWDEGIAKLHVGDQATFIIPPQIGYGERGRGPIPPQATLIFVVELLGIEEPPATP
jgi:FKBP-type peptidyl-prolyl cis-trans isomerase